jgi:short-subunit dehydrogenase
MENTQSTNKGKYALVTGATSGIGYEISKLLANDGYNLVVVARSNEQLQTVCDELRQFKVDVTAMEKDLFQKEAAQQIFQELKSRGLSIDVLVNDAGQGQAGLFHEVTLERHLEIIQLNVTTLVSLTHLFLTDMVKRGEGKILNLASVVSKTPAPEFAIYAASKAFVLSFSEALAPELKDTGVTVTALMPGRTDTAFFHRADMEDTKEYQEHKLADPADVAKDGYDAMMSGESKIISGAQNKMMVGMMNSMPDGVNASNMQKNIQPSDKDESERRQRPEHPASERERETIEKSQV